MDESLTEKRVIESTPDTNQKMTCTVYGDVVNSKGRSITKSNGRNKITLKLRVTLEREKDPFLSVSTMKSKLKRENVLFTLGEIIVNNGKKERIYRSGKKSTRHD